MRRGLHVLVAVDAGEHSAVDGLLQLFGVDGEADRLAVGIGGGERGVGVAGETLLVLRLVLGAGERGQREQEDDHRQRTELARRFMLQVHVRRAVTSPYLPSRCAFNAECIAFLRVEAAEFRGGARGAQRGRLSEAARMRSRSLLARSIGSEPFSRGWKTRLSARRMAWRSARGPRRMEGPGASSERGCGAVHAGRVLVMSGRECAPGEASARQGVPSALMAEQSLVFIRFSLCEGVPLPNFRTS